MHIFPDRYRSIVKKTIQALWDAIYEKVEPLRVICYKTPEPVPFCLRETGEYTEMAFGDSWGKQFDCGWFHFTGRVPESCKGKKVVLLIDVNGEGLIFDRKGTPLRGITCVSTHHSPEKGNPGKRLFHISQCAKGNEEIDIWMDAGCNDLFGTYKENGSLKEAHVAICDDVIRDAFYDAHVLEDLLDVLDIRSAQYNQILYGMYQACLEMKAINTEEVAAFGDKIRKLYKKEGESYLKFTAIGHAHIDLAWLWPMRETRRKAGRTFATVLQLMEQYPEYKFGASQPQMYQWVKEDYPALFEQIKQRVKEGRWEVQGCMWVEADANLSGGEAMVRQILYGKKFFREEFGVEVKNLWLPDVFGYSASMPQILRKSGCDYFMTQKLSWSQQNKFPHHTFLWQGIDGTEIFTHMLPEGTYNGPLKPTFIRNHAELHYMDSAICDESLMLFGMGDGGGGPGPEHLERYRRVKDLKGISNVEIGFAQPLFERLEEKTRGKLPKWTGELYLERHQGTYTSQAKGKWFNRKLEFALRELEFALILSGTEYPREKLEGIWKEVLLYQFHDIIPGSSIKRVYDETWARYQILLNEVQKMTMDCYRKVALQNRIAFNSLSWERKAVVRIDGTDYEATIPALGYTGIFKPLDCSELRAEGNVLENQNLRVEFDVDGGLISLYDKKNQREILGAKSNIYCVYDELDQADCWDINIVYTDRAPERFTLTDYEMFLDGAKAVCLQRYVYGSSTLTADISLTAGGDTLEVKLHADWHENNKMLRTQVNTNILTDHASFEIQYGKINRPNNDNTLWQKAQFEVCGHKWVDLSQDDYGVALLNDCKYGYRAVDKTIDINLLRSQNHPGIDADKGEHDIVYAIYPHWGNEKSGQVSRKAYELNVPVAVLDGNENPVKDRLFSVSGGIVVETVKMAEDSGKTVIRAYEPYGTAVDTEFAFQRTVTVQETDLMEKPVGEQVICDSYRRKFKPFEIVTFTLE